MKKRVIIRLSLSAYAVGL